MEQITAIILNCILILTFGYQELEEAIRQTTGQPNSGLSVDTIIAGLKESLEIGTQKVVDVVSRQNGYLNNKAITFISDPHFWNTKESTS